MVIISDDNRILIKLPLMTSYIPNTFILLTVTTEMINLYVNHLWLQK